MSNLYKNLEKIQLEKSKRIVSDVKIPLINYSFDPNGNSGSPAVSPKGTITFYVARKNSKAFAAVKKSASSDQPIDADLFQTILKQYAKRKVQSDKEALETIMTSEIIFGIRHADEMIISDLILPADLDVVIVSLPFVGDKMDVNAFTITQYSKDANQSAIVGMAVFNRARLSKAEAAAVNKIGPDKQRLLFGDTSPISWCPAVAVVATVITVATICFSRKMTNISIPEDRVKGQLPEYTAMELLEMRKKMLSGHLI